MCRDVSTLTTGPSRETLTDCADSSMPVVAERREKGMNKEDTRTRAAFELFRDTE